MAEMNKQLLAGWVIVILALLAYFSIAILLTGEVALTGGVLVLVLAVSFLIYKLTHRSLGNLELVRKMYADLKDTLERIKERVAEDEAPRRAAVSRRRQVLMNRESRRAATSKVVPVDKKYTDLIERRVREARANQDQSEGTSDTEP